MKLRTVLLAAGLVLPGCNCGSSTDPIISSFTATPANLPVDGGTVTLAWDVSGATSLSINQGVGAVTPLTSGSTTATVATSTTFTLSATDSTGTVTETAAVCVAGGPVTVTAVSPDSYTMCNTPFVTNVKMTNGSCETITATHVELMSAAGSCNLQGPYTVSVPVPPGQTVSVLDLTNGTICCTSSPCSISCTDAPTWTVTDSDGGTYVAISNEFSIELSDCNQTCP